MTRAIGTRLVSQVRDNQLHHSPFLRAAFQTSIVQCHLPSKLTFCPSDQGLQNAHRRYASTRRHVSSAAIDISSSQPPLQAASPMPSSSPMACIPLATLLRSYLIMTVSSYPMLLRPSLASLAFLARSRSAFLNPDNNPLLRFALKNTIYAQFCAGETAQEIRSTVTSLKSMGYRGVILAYAKEVVLEGDDAAQLDATLDCVEQDRCNAEEVALWEKGTLETVNLAEHGDYVALKFTGAGRQALQSLSAKTPCAPVLEEAVHKMCRLAKQRGVKLLFDAEQAELQEGIDHWTMYFMQRYNTPEQALVYGTYQAYAKRTPQVLARHLEEAKTGGFTLGVKLVRGAYLGSDPRNLFWSTIAETHECYDGIAESLIKRQYGDVLTPAKGSSGQFPNVNLVLASHNAESVARARSLRDEQALMRKPMIDLAYGQLMGMADNVSCEIVQAAKERDDVQQGNVDVPKAYKYLVWGTVGECTKYLLRRARENQDAVSRTVEGRKALGREILRRLGLVRSN